MIVIKYIVMLYHGLAQLVCWTLFRSEMKAMKEANAKSVRMTKVLADIAEAVESHHFTDKQKLNMVADIFGKKRPHPSVNTPKFKAKRHKENEIKNAKLAARQNKALRLYMQMLRAKHLKPDGENIILDKNGLTYYGQKIKSSYELNQAINARKKKEEKDVKK